MSATQTHPAYQPDVLGEGYEQLKLSFPDDYEGAVCATLVRKKASQNTQKAVLYAGCDARSRRCCPTRICGSNGLGASPPGQVPAARAARVCHPVHRVSSAAPRAARRRAHRGRPT